LGFELRAAQASCQGGGFAAGDLVLAQGLQEFEVAEPTVAGLGQPGVEGVEHAGQFQGPQRIAQRRIAD
jgi:hypothetical protein